MGSLVLDREVKELLILEAILEKFINLANVNLLFHLQFVMIREVERNRHVGLPHTALHVIHGQGVGARGKGFLSTFIIESYCIAFIEIFNRFATAGICIRLLCITSFYLADIRSVNKVSTAIFAKLQQARGFSVVATDIQCQFIIDVDPNVIIA